MKQKILNIDKISLLLTDRKLSVVAKRTNLSYNTIAKIRDNGELANPTLSTVRALSAYLSGTL